MKRHFKELIERHFKGVRKNPFIDDNEKKWNKYLDGVRIAGGCDQILASVDRYNIDKIK